MKMKLSKPQLRRIETSVGPADALGNIDLLGRNKLALICSRKCPGDVILRTYDFGGLVRKSELAIVSGFHSPVEKDCLRILLRGTNPIIMVQARRITAFRPSISLREALDVGRLLILSPFEDKKKRVTEELATVRNAFVASIAEEVLIPYASPNSKTEELAFALLASGKRVVTFDDHPGALLTAGAQVVSPEYSGSFSTVGTHAGGEV
jgi:predicted Rossmann fold nucleotide-binding protein DprA/Smf involved in DNA uptake